ncbi:MAG: Gfo/Idh/MocA family oxidoreductase [Tannerella sp.]|jgi:virulence factor|nr:Gfo/Idh/MocA family oxidoreductase [Tannerella sp.]
MNNAIELFKRIRKKRYLDRQYAHKYAFVGIGNHSINNLYPVLHYLNVPLKYIVSRSRQTAEMINRNYAPVIGTADYEEVLNDPEIGGVFICASPSQHYQLVKSALLKQKNVFVEKPPCADSVELTDLMEINGRNKPVCVSGFQKRYSVCTSILKERLPDAKTISYNYRFLVGAYPEGDVLTEIFIHPIDYVLYLFGEMEILSVAKTERGKGQVTLLLQVRHKNSTGNIEMSTQYAWNQAQEELSVNTVSGVYRMENHQTLTFMPKPPVVFSVPTEKFLQQNPEKKYLYNGNDMLPVFRNNQLVSLGYYNEIKTFVELCENRKSKNLSPLNSLENTFKAMEFLNR